MNLVIIGTARAEENDLASVKAKSAFRKATRKMMLVAAAVEKMSERLPWLNDRAVMAPQGFVLNSGFGELEATLDFLKAFEETGLARPLFFQNSLHNSTTGFIAIQLGIQGPVLTVNHRLQGGTQAFETALTLIRAGECEACLIASVETVPLDFNTSGGVGEESASLLLVSTREFADRVQAKVLAHADSVDTASVSTVPPGSALRSLQSEDLIHRVVSTLA